MALRDQLEEIYHAHAQGLYRFVIRLSGDESTTHDILQEIFSRLARSPDLLGGVAEPRSYLFRMAHRLVIDRHRREDTRAAYERAAGEETPSATEPEPATRDVRWLQRTLAAALDALPPEQRAVVALKVWEEMTFAQIAKILGIPANTAASRYRYALDKLRADLRPLQGELK